MMGILMLLQTLCLCHLFMYSAIGKFWIRVDSFDNSFPISGGNVASRSRIHCSEICSQNDSCSSFFFTRSQLPNCKLYDHVLLSIMGLTFVNATRYYILDGGPATVNTASGFDCPADDTGFRTVLLDVGVTFTYKVHKYLANFTSANEACEQQDSYLARVTSILEMTFLRKLAACPGSDAFDYLVDGSNSNASDFYTMNAWKMSNGHPVPTTTDFWGAGFPNHPYIQHCLRMRAAISHRFDDTFCNNTFYFICEK